MESDFFCLTGIFLPNLYSNRECEWKIIGEILESSLKNKSRSHLLKEIFRSPDSKSLRLKQGVFEIPLSHGVWGSPLKCVPNVCAKAVSSLLRERTKKIVYVTYNFLKTT